MMGVCREHQDDDNAVCLPWTECNKAHCEYCGSTKCCTIADGITVCSRCERVLFEHIEISTGEKTK